MWVAGGCRGEFLCAGLEITCGFKGQNASLRTCSCEAEELPRESCERGCSFVSASYRCSGPRYEALLASLPPVTCDGLQLRRGARVLFFGSSSLGQILDSVLCANKVVSAVDRRRSVVGDDYRQHTTHARQHGPCPHGRCRSHAFSQYELSENRTIVSVINWSPLQRLSRIVDGTLTRCAACPTTHGLTITRLPIEGDDAGKPKTSLPTFDHIDLGIGRIPSPSGERGFDCSTSSMEEARRTSDHPPANGVVRCADTLPV